MALENRTRFPVLCKTAPSIKLACETGEGRGHQLVGRCEATDRVPISGELGRPPHYRDLSYV